MLQTSIELQLDRNEIRNYIHRKLDEEVREVLWLIDLDKMAELVCMSKRWLEDEIVCDPRMRVIERRKNRKRWWPAKQALEIIHQITLEW